MARGLFSMVTWGIKCAHTRRAQAQNKQLHNFCRVQYSSAERVAKRQLPVPSSHGSKDQRSRYRRYICVWQLRSGTTSSRLAS